MTNNFKKWLCELYGKDKIECLGSCNSDVDKMCNECVGGYFWSDFEVTLEILIKAMWKINRDTGWNIQMDNIKVYVSGFKENTGKFNYFFYNEHNNSEQQALEAALEYIYKHDKR